MQSSAVTVEQYLAEMPEERRQMIETVRKVILENLPSGYEEAMNWGMITYQVPLEVYPDTYNKKPLMYAALAAQKNHMAIYLTAIYMDAWLESQIADENRLVLTYGIREYWFQEALRTALFTFGLMESIIALVAALALAGLNYIFVTQRQVEFGVLNALGFSRSQLVWRVTRETLFITGVAWILGVVCCAIVIAYMQYDLYTPLGFRLNFFNLAPWMYTLPIPVAVLAASAAAVGWALARLDPVAVVERR